MTDRKIEKLLLSEADKAVSSNREKVLSACGIKTVKPDAFPWRTVLSGVFAAAVLIAAAVVCLIPVYRKNVEKGSETGPGTEESEAVSEKNERPDVFTVDDSLIIRDALIEYVQSDRVYPSRTGYTASDLPAINEAYYEISLVYPDITFYPRSSLMVGIDGERIKFDFVVGNAKTGTSFAYNKSDGKATKTSSFFDGLYDLALTKFEWEDYELKLKRMMKSEYGKDYMTEADYYDRVYFDLSYEKESDSVFANEVYISENGTAGYTVSCRIFDMSELEERRKTAKPVEENKEKASVILLDEYSDTGFESYGNIRDAVKKLYERACALCDADPYLLVNTENAALSEVFFMMPDTPKVYYKGSAYWLLRENESEKERYAAFCCILAGCMKNSVIYSKGFSYPGTDVSYPRQYILSYLLKTQPAEAQTDDPSSPVRLLKSEKLFNDRLYKYGGEVISVYFDGMRVTYTSYGKDRKVIQNDKKFYNELIGAGAEEPDPDAMPEVPFSVIKEGSAEGPVALHMNGRTYYPYVDLKYKETRGADGGLEEERYELPPHENDACYDYDGGLRLENNVIDREMIFRNVSYLPVGDDVVRGVRNTERLNEELEKAADGYYHVWVEICWENTAAPNEGDHYDVYVVRFIVKIQGHDLFSRVCVFDLSDLNPEDAPETNLPLGKHYEKVIKYNAAGKDLLGLRVYSYFDENKAEQVCIIGSDGSLVFDTDTKAPAEAPRRIIYAAGPSGPVIFWSESEQIDLEDQKRCRKTSIFAYYVGERRRETLAEIGPYAYSSGLWDMSAGISYYTGSHSVEVHVSGVDHSNNRAVVNYNKRLTVVYKDGGYKLEDKYTNGK